MGVPNHNLDALEEQRLALEENILQLEKSLYHWRTWEAEYDGVREEISNLEDDASTHDFLAVALEFGGTLVDEKEMHAILGAQGVVRSRGQVVDILGRRIDYVKQNVATMEKRLRKVEDERDVLDLKDLPPVQGGADFPLQEIMEELDEDGNVVSSSINTPGNQATELLDVLKKAGVKDIVENSEPEKTAAPAEATVDVTDGEPESSKAAEKQKDPSGRQNTSPLSNVISVDEMDFTQPQSVVTDEDRKQPPVTDVNESLEEAKLRREMLEYGINEVGAIVAELEMDESGSEISFDEDYDYDDDYEEEDEWGRSRPNLTADYHQEMIELEAKLNARGLMNMGKNTETFPEEVQQEIENPTEVPNKASTKEKKPKKRVAFADDLDIAPAPTPSASTEKVALPQDEPTVLADAIVERTSHSQDPALSSTTSAVPKKTSRFKSARSAASGSGEAVTTGATTANPSQVTETRIRKQANATPSAAPPVLFPATPKEPKPFSAPITDIVEKPSAPQPPQDRTLADKVFERQVKTGAAKAPELDYYDEELHQKQIASEFFNMQNRMNGSKKEEEQQVFPPDDPAELNKRVSKFKASRLG
jgi:unconventional prefoldin RPB5 interactor 1